MGTWQSNTAPVIRKLIGDIRFWILLFFIARLFSINAPIFESHSWRQADGYSIARNFLEIDANPFYPRIDHAGHLTGIMGSEFPLMNYLVYLFYLFFDVDWWQGRLVNLIAASVGTMFFFKILYRYINKEIAFNASMILLCSIWLSHGRKFMPDVFSTSLVITGVYFGWRYLHSEKGGLHLVLFGILCCAGLLSKLPAFIATALLVPGILDKEIPIIKKYRIAATSAILILPVLFWYFYWAPLLTENYGHFYFFMGSSVAQCFAELTSEWKDTIYRFYYDPLHYIGFGFYIIGIVFCILHNNKKLLILFAAASCLQLLFMLNAGHSFAHHSYYIVPFVPIMAIFAAYCLSQVNKKWIQYTLLFFVVAEGIGNQQHEFRIKQDMTYMLRLETLADKFTEKDDRLAINNELNPASLYFAHRKGWTISSADTSGTKNYQLLIDRNCDWIFWDKHREEVPKSMPSFEKVHEDTDFIIYKSAI